MQPPQLAPKMCEGFTCGDTAGAGSGRQMDFAFSRFCKVDRPLVSGGPAARGLVSYISSSGPPVLPDPAFAKLLAELHRQPLSPPRLSLLTRETFTMGLEDDGFLGLKDTNDQDDMYHTTFPVMPIYTIQESNIGALYRDNGPWITQNMDIAQLPPRGAHSSSVTQSSSFEFALSDNSRFPTLPTTRVNLPLPSVRQRTAQACDKCRERKTKCSGHRPVCLRCMTRGLICEYSARETRLRLPTQSRFHPGHIRPVSDPEAIMQQVNYQPATVARSRLGNDPLLVGFCEPKPVYLGHPTMAFSSDRYPDWNGYQERPFVYGDPTIVAPSDTRLSVESSLPFSLFQASEPSKY